MDQEASYFSPLACNALDIINRSPNFVFKKQCRRLIEKIKQKNAQEITRLAHSLSVSLGAELTHPIDDPISDEESLCQALENMYKTSMPRPSPKVVFNLKSIIHDSTKTA
jgi:hypothetical protein